MACWHAGCPCGVAVLDVPAYFAEMINRAQCCAPRGTIYTRAGVESFEVDLATQKVTVKGNVTPEAVLEKVSKTGKATELWQ